MAPQPVCWKYIDYFELWVLEKQHIQGGAFPELLLRAPGSQGTQLSSVPFLGASSTRKD